MYRLRINNVNSTFCRDLINYTMNLSTEASRWSRLMQAMREGRDTDVREHAMYLHWTSSLSVFRPNRRNVNESIEVIVEFFNLGEHPQLFIRRFLNHSCVTLEFFLSGKRKRLLKLLSCIVCQLEQPNRPVEVQRLIRENRVNMSACAALVYSLLATKNRKTEAAMFWDIAQGANRNF